MTAIYPTRAPRQYLGRILFIKPAGRVRVGYSGPWPPPFLMFARLDDDADEYLARHATVRAAMGGES